MHFKSFFTLFARRPSSVPQTLYWVGRGLALPSHEPRSRSQPSALTFDTSVFSVPS